MLILCHMFYFQYLVIVIVLLILTTKTTTSSLMHIGNFACNYRSFMIKVLFSEIIFGQQKIAKSGEL